MKNGNELKKEIQAKVEEDNKCACGAEGFCVLLDYDDDFRVVDIFCEKCAKKIQQEQLEAYKKDK